MRANCWDFGLAFAYILWARVGLYRPIVVHIYIYMMYYGLKPPHAMPVSAGKLEVSRLGHAVMRGPMMGLTAVT